MCNPSSSIIGEVSLNSNRQRSKNFGFTKSVSNLTDKSLNFIQVWIIHVKELTGQTELGGVLQSFSCWGELLKRWNTDIGHLTASSPGGWLSMPQIHILVWLFNVCVHYKFKYQIIIITVHWYFGVLIIALCTNSAQLDLGIVDMDCWMRSMEQPNRLRQHG